MLTSLDISKIRSMIQSLNSYNLVTEKKRLKKSLEQFTDQIKKQKKYRSIGDQLSIKYNTLSPEIKILPQSL